MPPAADAAPIVIRRATAADVPVAMRIIREALAGFGLPFEPNGRDADVRFFGGRPDHDDFVAEAPERGAVGVASVGPHGEPGTAWVSKVFVDHAARRRGAGRALLRAAHAAAKARGYVRVGLRSRVIFEAAIRLYESEGYALTSDPALLEAGDVVYFRAL